MPAPVNREEFLDLVRKSGVVDDDRVASFTRTVLDSGVAIDQPRAVAERMVRNGLLTTFQAKQLLQGKWRRFLINGKYKLLELLGAGGMGTVYLCEHVYMRRLVALKVLPADKLKDPSTLDRFYREARAAGALDHPNIVRAFDIDREETDAGPLHFLVMEYVDGASLQEIVARRGPMTPVRAAHYVAQAAKGLQHAHEAGLVHRDIKPGNLLLDRSGTVKVLDLGLARFFHGPAKDNVTERYDEKNAILGTADYLAPEQARGEAVDIRADIYSLGGTLYFLLTGKAPFEEGSVTQKLLWSQTRAPKPVRELRADVPAELEAVMDRMLAKDPKDRFPTPAAVAEALAPWTATPIPAPPAEEMPRRSPAALAGAQSQAPIVPSTPAPKSVPRDLGRKLTTGPASARPTVRPAAGGPSTARRQAAATAEAPAEVIIAGPPPDDAPAGPTSNPFVVVPDNSRFMIMAAAGGGAALVILGGLLAWFLIGRSQPSQSGPPAVASQPAPTTPRTTPTTPAAVPGTLTPDEAAKLVGKQCAVEFTARHVGKATSAERYFINSKADYRSADNFTVTFTKQVADQLHIKSAADAQAVFENKKIVVIGTVQLYSDRPQIEVTDASQIKGVEPKP